MIETLQLVRHGETEHNLAGITQGWNDSLLSERGRQQVALLAERLRGSDVTSLYTSSLPRAMTTAQAIADVTGLPLRVLDELREMNYGTWEGKSFLDIRSENADLYKRWAADPDAACPEGESHTGVRERLQTAINVIEAEGGERPLVVSHGTAIRVAATTLLGLPLTACRLFAVDNASLSVFMRRADRWVLKVWNDATHCQEFH